MCHFHFCLDFRSRHTSPAAATAAAWHVRDWVSITLQRKPDVEIVEVLEHTTNTAKHTYRHTHTALSCLAAAAIKDDTTKRNATLPGNSGKEIAMDTGHTAWQPRSATDTAGQLVREGQGKGARFKCAQSQLNWGSNDSIYALANLQLRLKCVCVCVWQGEEACRYLWADAKIVAGP